MVIVVRRMNADYDSFCGNRSSCNHESRSYVLNILMTLDMENDFRNRHKKKNNKNYINSSDQNSILLVHNALWFSE